MGNLSKVVSMPLAMMKYKKPYKRRLWLVPTIPTENNFTNAANTRYLITKQVLYNSLVNAKHRPKLIRWQQTIKCSPKPHTCLDRNITKSIRKPRERLQVHMQVKIPHLPQHRSPMQRSPSTCQEGCEKQLPVPKHCPTKSALDSSRSATSKTA